MTINHVQSEEQDIQCSEEVSRQAGTWMPQESTVPASPGKQEGGRKGGESQLSAPQDRA
jgi:hypothetical protein